MATDIMLYVMELMERFEEFKKKDEICKLRQARNIAFELASYGLLSWKEAFEIDRRFKEKLAELTGGRYP